jgi:hypothetical protein
MTSQAIEEKLKNSDCTLNELLDEEEIIQEMKSGNAKLLNLYTILSNCFHKIYFQIFF